MPCYHLEATDYEIGKDEPYDVLYKKIRTMTRYNCIHI